MKRDIDKKQAEAAGQRCLRVLVADDDRDNTDSWATLLRLAGHEVRAVYSGADALQAAAEFAPQLALIDVAMPEMNGYEVARRIRAAEWGKDIVLVAVTGWTQEKHRLEAQASGFDHHMRKPVDFNALQPLLQQRSGADGAGD